MKMPNTCGHVIGGLKFLNYWAKLGESESQKWLKLPFFDPLEPLPSPIKSKLLHWNIVLLIKIHRLIFVTNFILFRGQNGQNKFR